MLTVSDIARVLSDCGDGVEVKADGRSLLTAQVEGTDPKYLNLVSQPEGVRLPEGAQDQVIPGLEPGAVGNAGTPMPAWDPAPVDPAPTAPASVDTPADTTDLI